MRMRRRRATLTTAAFMVAYIATAGMASCRTQQAQLHPNLSQMGQVIASVKPIADGAQVVQTKTAAMVKAGDLTPAQARPVIEATIEVGYAEATIGKLFLGYQTAADATVRVKAETDIFAQVVIMTEAVLKLKEVPASIAADISAMQAIAKDVPTSAAAAVKGS